VNIHPRRSDSLYLVKDRSSCPGEAEENALEKGKSSSTLPHKPFSRDVGLVVDLIERATVHSVVDLQTGLL
jgi:hypothetical protein